MNDAARECNVSQQSIRAQRSAAAELDYPQAAQLADEHGMVLHSFAMFSRGSYYRLDGPGGDAIHGKRVWRMEIYPGVQKTRNQPGRSPIRPDLDLPDEWTLLDVVQAAIKAIPAANGETNA
jgi:hypothetical protein